MIELEAALEAEGSSELYSMQRRNILLLAVKTVFDKFVDLSFGDDKAGDDRQTTLVQKSCYKVYCSTCSTLANMLTCTVGVMYDVSSGRVSVHLNFMQ